MIISCHLNDENDSRERSTHNCCKVCSHSNNGKNSRLGYDVRHDLTRNLAKCKSQQCAQCQQRSENAASGTGPVAHVLAGAFVPVGRFGIVGQVKYSVAQVEFKETDETLGMGGITLAAGVDFAF